MPVRGGWESLPVRIDVVRTRARRGEVRVGETGRIWRESRRAMFF